MKLFACSAIVLVLVAIAVAANAVAALADTVGPGVTH